MAEIITKWGGAKEADCKNCGSTFRYMPSECFEIFVGANYGGERPQPVYAIKCPACGKRTRVGRG